MDTEVTVSESRLFIYIIMYSRRERPYTDVPPLHGFPTPAYKSESSSTPNMEAQPPVRQLKTFP